MSEINCPVDLVMVNNNRMRLVALQVFILVVIHLVYSHWVIPAFLTVDFFIRAFSNPQYSVLNMVAGFLVKTFSVKNKPVDRAPKRFAAKVGFIFCDLLFIASFFSFEIITVSLTAIMILFSFLESFVGLCAGCYVYYFLKKFNPSLK